MLPIASMTLRTGIELAAVAWSLTFVAPAIVERRPSQPLERLEKSDEVMGAAFSIVLYGADRDRLESAAAAGLEEAHRLDRLLSNYRPDSEWSRVNRDAGSGPVRVSRELFELLRDCVEYSRQSDGAFDITVGPLMKVWGFYKGEGELPPRTDVTQVLDRIGYRHLRLDPIHQTIQFGRPGMELDPGGIGKGYAVDRVIDRLKGRGVRTALVSASGSSIYGLGAPPDEPRGWPVTIQAPGDPTRTAADVFLRDTALSTSGSYERFFRAGGRTYSHLLDPRTGYPAQGTAAVSVLAPRTIDTEAWTKPSFINGRKWTAANKPAHLRVFFCDDGPRVACGWLP